MRTETHQILELFEEIRMNPILTDQYNTVGKSLLAERIDKFVVQNKTIDFVMLGLPFKSTNDRDKVLGKVPDMGEQLTMRHFATFNKAVKEVYSPGVKFNVASDGYIFNELLEVTDKTVETYKEICLDMGNEEKAPIQIFDLNDFYSNNNLVVKREKMMTQFGVDYEQLEKKILFDADTNALYRGMIRFMQEELAPRNYASNNQLAKAAKLLTRNMMLYNEAWSNLVKEEFSSMIRLSMHPSINNGAKYSIKLLPGNKAHHSAWHSVVVLNQNTNEIQTLHKKDAVAAGYELVELNNKPSHFVS